MPCVRWPLLSVGLIAQQRRGSVGGAAGQGTNQPPPPTGRTKAARSFSVGTMAAAAIRRRSKGAADASVRGNQRGPRRRRTLPLIAAIHRVTQRQSRHHGGYQREPPTQCLRRRCRRCPSIAAAVAVLHARWQRQYVTALSAFFRLTAPSDRYKFLKLLDWSVRFLAGPFVL